MITVQLSARVGCDHNHYDSACLASGILMAGAANTSSCRVELGPFSSERAAVESCQAAGWLVVERPAHAGGGTIQVCYCPVHRTAAAEWWSQVTKEEAAGEEEPGKLCACIGTCSHCPNGPEAEVPL